MKLRLVEPERWYAIIDQCIELSERYPRIETFAPIGADIFVIIYPFFLIFLYLKGIFKKQLDRKEGALFIFFSCLISVIINTFLQSFFLKNRPNMDFFESDVGDTLLHALLPNSSFPSDHAVVGMSIAVASLIRWYKTKNKSLIFFAYILVLIALIMSICRVITIVHRPSDILGGFILAAFVPLVLSHPFLLQYVKKWLITPLIKLQEKIFTY
jgi:undecaprenyl-diphosphatase